MKHLTIAEEFFNAQVDINNLPPVERKLNLLKLGREYGLKDISRHYHSGSVYGSQGEVQFPYLNVEVEGYPATGSGAIFSHGGVHIRPITKLKPALYLGTADDVATLDGVLDRKFAVELKSSQPIDQEHLDNPDIVVSFVVPRKYRLYDEVTKWDYVNVVSENSENLRGKVRQGLRRKLRKNENEIITEYFVDRYFEELLAFNT